MQEVTGDLFDFSPPGASRVLRCITTNGVVNSLGDLVMGKGIALQAKKRYPYIEIKLGKLVREIGNRVHVLPDISLATFPTKQNWRDLARLDLIEASCNQIVDHLKDWDAIVIPRPGCGNGGLEWLAVKSTIANILTSDRIYVIDLIGGNKNTGQ